MVMLKNHCKTHGFLSMGLRKPRKTHGFLSVVLRKPRKTHGFLSTGLRKNHSPGQNLIDFPLNSKRKSIEIALGQPRAESD